MMKIDEISDVENEDEPWVQVQQGQCQGPGGHFKSTYELLKF